MKPLTSDEKANIRRLALNPAFRPKAVELAEMQRELTNRVWAQVDWLKGELATNEALLEVAKANLAHYDEALSEVAL